MRDTLKELLINEEAELRDLESSQPIPIAKSEKEISGGVAEQLLDEEINMGVTHRSNHRSQE